MKAENISGGGGTFPRKKSDFYPTPPAVTQSLLNWLALLPDTFVWEPAAGDGRMVDVIRSNGYRCTATDIQTGTDFLTAPDPGCDWIITNPPFCLATDFIRRGLELKKPFAFLLKSSFWHAQKRQKLFIKHPPEYILPLTWRPNFNPDIPDKEASPPMDVCWNIWSPLMHGDMPFYCPINKP